VREAKRKIIVTVLALAIAMLATPFVGTVMAKKPIMGTMDLEFNLSWPGPQADIPDWVGTVTIDSSEYGMAFFCIGSGKPFADDPGKVHFFEEIWVIYDYLEFDFGTQELNYGQILFWGYDKGVVSLANSHYVMNGNVEEAHGDFAIWQGHNVHMSGDIVWYEFGAPHYAPGTFQING
jgi:hypothetical protein